MSTHGVQDTFFYKRIETFKKNIVYMINLETCTWIELKKMQSGEKKSVKKLHA
jgi:hypothetical protein